MFTILIYLKTTVTTLHTFKYEIIFFYKNVK